MLNVDILMFIFTACTTMSEELKYIVNELNRSPFNKNFNLISFDSLNSEQLIQVRYFSEICTWPPFTIHLKFEILI
jgi:hypothetical protein